MSILAWIVLGLVAGFIASRVVDGAGRGAVLDMVLGVIGAMVGGATFHFFGQTGITGFDLWSLLVAVVGACLVLGAYHAVSGSFARDRPQRR